VLKRLTVCLPTEHPVRLFPASLAVSSEISAVRNPGTFEAWEHVALETGLDRRRCHAANPVADYAGWTEVVIPRGRCALIDLPVGRNAADTTSISPPWPAVTVHDDQVFPWRRYDRPVQCCLSRRPDSQAGKPNGGALRHPDELGAFRLSCPNNYEVTL